MDPNLPINQNINWVQLIAAVATILTMFGINLDPKTQAAVVAVIVGLTTVITWVLHTFINHPANQAKAADIAFKAVQIAKKASPVLAIGFVVIFGLGLSGCAGSGLFDNPQQDLATAEIGLDGAEIIYASFCQSDTTASWCSAANMQKANDAFNAVSNAIKTAQAVITADPGQSQITAAITGVANSVASFVAIMNDLQSQKAKAMMAKKVSLVTPLTGPADPGRWHRIMAQRIAFHAFDLRVMLMRQPHRPFPA